MEKNITNNQSQDLSNQRNTENLHIVFWLVKDISWCLQFKFLGILMIVPTLIISIYFTVKNKKITSELYHNLAVTLWIIANSYWMLSEFFKFDDKILCQPFNYKHLAAIPFGLGIIVLGYFYGLKQNKSVL